ncbi:hypothetical protein HAX54_000730 [Datura stramonium]|uniref:Uncharacterized protein n=1 Tax=Datura stramonium TaxID=4076 RepID=A0ABS8T290_DATST|nr:hypothetical protein [Datura stramonium]
MKGREEGNEVVAICSRVVLFTGEDGDAAMVACGVDACRKLWRSVSGFGVGSRNQESRLSVGVRVKDRGSGSRLGLDIGVGYRGSGFESRESRVRIGGRGRVGGRGRESGSDLSLGITIGIKN